MANGLTAGFGFLLGPALLADIKAGGWSMIRNGDPHTRDRVVLAAMAEEVTAAGMTPVLSGVAGQADLFPKGCIIELQAFIDPTPTGLEPSLRGNDPRTECLMLNQVAGLLKANGNRAYVGMTGFDRTALAWLSELLAGLDPYYRVSVHRYPPTGATQWWDTHEESREVELAHFNAVRGNRRWAMLECGWNQGPFKKWWWQHLFGTHSHLTDQQQAACVKGELAWSASAGADFTILYQLNDGPVRCPEHPQYCANWRESFGVRRADGSWKPSAALGGVTSWETKTEP